MNARHFFRQEKGKTDGNLDESWGKEEADLGCLFKNLFLEAFALFGKFSRISDTLEVESNLKPTVFFLSASFRME